jgi:DNA-binding MarR family transcriptional regulator
MTEVLMPVLQRWMAVFMRRSMHNFMQYAKDSGLTMPQIGALMQLMRKGPCGVSNIAEQLDVTSAAACQMVDRLVQQGFVLRTEDPTDRRLKQIVLTDKGHHVLKHAAHARQAWLEELAAQLTPAEQEQVGAALSILIEKAELIEPAAPTEA